VYASAGVAVISALWFLLHAVAGVGTPALALVAAPIGTVIGGLSVFALLRHVPMAPAARRFWQLILVLEIGVGLGRVLHVAGVFASHPAPARPSMVVSVLFLLGLGAGIVALSRVPLGRVRPADRWKQLLDRSIAFGGCFTVMVFAGLAPVLDETESRPYAKLLTVLTMLMIAAGVSRVAFVPGGPVDRVAVQLIASSGLGAIAYVICTAHLGPAAATAGQAVLMPLGPLIMTLAVRRQWRYTGAQPQHESALPYLAVAAVDIPLVITVLRPMTWADQIVVVLAVGVTLLATVRQFLAFRENQRLMRAQRESQERLRHEATHDLLTGLANRGLFRDRLAAALAADGATVAIVDLDDFKTVNDSLGHAIGDDLLVAVADALREAVGADGFPARLGGDEFAVLIGDPAVSGDAVVERITTALSGSLSEHRLLMHASAGLTSAPAGTPLDQLMRDADTALNFAKQRGKDNWIRFVPGMERPVLADAQLGADLRRGLDAGEFRVVYQPLVDLHRNRVIGVEALVRWQHPTRGLVSPADFIPVAERTGLIVPLGRFVLRETCRQAAAWLAEFGPEVLQKAGPNVSVRQLHDPDFVDDVRAALADSGLPGELLVLELTESAVLRGQQVSRALHELHGMGVRLALDDFGTGESSLSLLRAFPASIVKLDKSFVDGIELDEPGSPEAVARQAVARAVIQMAGALDLDTVAEGIENAEQAELLRRLGYTLGQGYHLAMPMGPDAVTQMLAGQRSTAAA
jgi:diguanylate cyclase (GGDEF)-like protein